MKIKIRKKIVFVTSNKDKIIEATHILDRFKIDIKNRRIKFNELADTKLENIVIDKAMQAKLKIKSPFIVDDAGIFFEAYPNFPGPFTKQIFEFLGYDGILKLLRGKNRKAYFKTVVFFVGNNGDIRMFKGICRGYISKRVKGQGSSDSPFNRLFVPCGKKKTFAQLGIKKQIEISHRAKALKEFAQYFNKF
jgi:XTP/dITP diphosphohydrolase